MSKKLNNVIEKSLKFSDFYKDKNIDRDEEAKFSFEAARDRTAKEIYEEIKNELKEEAINEAQEEIKSQKLIHKIKELRTLTIIGVIIAFFIGMGVNQATELISSYEWTNNRIVMSFFTVVFIGITIVIILCLALKEERKWER